MMTKKIKHSYFLLLALLLPILIGCIEDKGNYSYEVLSQAIIKDADKVGNATATTNSVVYIKPEIDYTEGKGLGDYSFEWHLYDVYFNTVEIISEGDTPELNRVLPALMNKSGSYNLMFMAKNNQSQVKYFKKYTVTVLNTIQVGYVAISEKNEGLDLDLIALYKDTLTLLPNVLDLMKSEYPKEGRKPLGITAFADVTAPSPYDTDATRVKYSLYLLTDQGADRLKPEDYSYKEEDYSIKRVSVINSRFIPESGYIPEKMEYYSDRQYIYLGTNWFFACRYVMLYLFMDPINTPYGETNYYRAAPFLVNSGDAAVLYDMDNNRFMRQQATTTQLYTSKEVLSTRALPDVEGDVYKFNDPNYTLVYMGRIATTNGFAVMKHKTTGSHEVWTFSYSSISVTKIARFILPATLDVGTMKQFIYHAQQPYLYCFSENKIYLLSMTSANPTLVDLSNELIPSGHKVSMLRSLYPKITNRTLTAIATYDPQKELDNCGTLRIYTTNSFTGKLELANHPESPTTDGYQIPMKWDGLGKVIDLDYKQQ